MELAKLFATVGFKVDKDGLTEFRKEMADLKVHLKEAATQTGKLKNQLTGLTAQFKQFQKMTDTRGVTKWMEGIEKSITHLNNMQNAVGREAQRGEQWADRFASSIFKLHQAIAGRKNEVAEYAQAIMLLAASFERLKSATAGISRFRQVPSSAISNTGAGYGGARAGAGRPSGGGGGGDANQYIGYWGRASGIAKSGPAAFLRPMLPTGMGLFNAVAGGYAFKELVNTGREMMQLESMLKVVSGTQANFNDNLAFTKKLANELGIDIQNLTESYAKTYLAGSQLFDKKTLQDAFKGSQTYFRLLGMSQEKIKLSNKAIEQMMNKQRVNAEDLRGQLAEHAAGVLQFFADAATGGSVTKLTELMELGKVDVDAIVKAMQLMGEYANASPELQKMLKMSTAEQGRFNNALKDFSKVVMESGLDEMLAEMFNGLSKLVTILTPFIKGLVIALNTGIKPMVKWLWEFKGAIVAVTAAVLGAAGLGYALGLIYAHGIGYVAVLMSMAKATWALYWPMLRLSGLIGVLAFGLQGLNDFHNGEDNWVHAWQLDIEYAMILWDTFVLGVWNGWEDMQNGLNPFFDKDSFPYSPPDVQKKILKVFDGSDRTPSGRTREEVDSMFDRFREGAKPKTPAMEKPGASILNFDINFNSLPADVQEAAKSGDFYAFGKGIGDGLRIGGIGVYS
jgi:tape measure domain-containing protein